MELTQCEKIVMDVIWGEDHDLTLQEVIDGVNRDRKNGWSKKAVSAFLRRLRKKDFVSRYRKGCVVLYHPLMEREDVEPYLTIFTPRHNLSPFL